MRRPSFRTVLTLAAMVGAAVVGSKVVKGRAAALPAAPAPDATWPPLAGADASPVPSTPVPAPGGTEGAEGRDVPGTTAGDARPAPAAERVEAPAAAAPPPSTVGAVDESPPVVETVAVLTPSSGSDLRSDETMPIAMVPSGDDGPAAAGPSDAVADQDAGSDGPGGRSWTFGGEGETDSDRSAGSPLRADNPSLDPEPEAVLPAERIDAARDGSALIAHGDEDEVPPAPEPTFGTAPDSEAAATAPVHVATPIEADPDEPLPIPHRPTHQPGSTS